jgi:hypothetical protein
MDFILEFKSPNRVFIFHFQNIFVLVLVGKIFDHSLMEVLENRRNKLIYKLILNIFLSF